MSCGKSLCKVMVTRRGELLQLAGMTYGKSCLVSLCFVLPVHWRGIRFAIGGFSPRRKIIDFRLYYGYPKVVS